jgi:site-specific recombinase XerD
MLETYYKDKRTLANFRRGPLGPHFDGFADHFTKKGYAPSSVPAMLKRCYHFNAFLMDQGISDVRSINRSLAELFLVVYLLRIKGVGVYKKKVETTTKYFLNHFFIYLIETGVLHPEVSKQVVTPYSQLMEPYLKYLREEHRVTEAWIQRIRKRLVPFLEGLGDQARPEAIKSLRAEDIEKYIKKLTADRRRDLRCFVGVLRGFLRFCVRQGYMVMDLSGMAPSVPSYRLSSLPRGMDDSMLKRVLHSVPLETPSGLRDYAILLIMMTYGIRGKQAAELLLGDIHWERSTIRIRALKGGKDVELPLLESVGEAILSYLRHRRKSPLREVFLLNRAPFRPLTWRTVEHMVQRYLIKAGVKIPRSGASTFRHSWAIRALAHGNSMKAIADVLGHRRLDNTFIYAKADLKTLRQVAMPWVEVAS